MTLHLCAFLVGTPLSKQYADQMTPVDYYSNQTGSFAVEECKELISTYPDLFAHMFEYKTELRQKLKYFELFIAVWQIMQPVYQYISEKYETNRLIDMYYDFVEANKDILQQSDDIERNELINNIIKDDKFAQGFNDDENYDLIVDYYRLQNIMRTKDFKETKSFMDLFCFDVNTTGTYISIKDYPRGKFMTVCNKGKFATFLQK